MKKFWRDHKKEIVGTLLGIVGTLITLWLTNLFSKPEPGKLTFTQNPITNSIVQDSAQQTINQVPQINQNKGDVNNDFVVGDKIVNHTTIKQSKKKQDTTIVNSGIINNGGTGNTYNQTINPGIPQRHFGTNELNWFTQNIPDSINYFAVYIYNHDPESIVFANETIKVLESNGYICQIKPFGTNFAPVPQDKIGRIDVNIFNESHSLDFIIYPLK